MQDTFMKQKYAKIVEVHLEVITSKELKKILFFCAFFESKPSIFASHF